MRQPDINSSYKQHFMYFWIKMVKTLVLTCVLTTKTILIFQQPLFHQFLHQLIEIEGFLMLYTCICEANEPYIHNIIFLTCYDEKVLQITYLLPNKNS